MIHARGHLGQAAIDAVLRAGFSQQNMLDVVLGVSQKNMSTIVNAIAGTEIDTAFQWAGFKGFKQASGG